MVESRTACILAEEFLPLARLARAEVVGKRAVMVVVRTIAVASVPLHDYRRMHAVIIEHADVPHVLVVLVAHQRRLVRAVVRRVVSLLYRSLFLTSHTVNHRHISRSVLRALLLIVYDAVAVSIASCVAIDEESISLVVRIPKLSTVARLHHHISLAVAIHIVSKNHVVLTSAAQLVRTKFHCPQMLARTQIGLNIVIKPRRHALPVYNIVHLPVAVQVGRPHIVRTVISCSKRRLVKTDTHKHIAQVIAPHLMRHTHRALLPIIGHLHLHLAASRHLICRSGKVRISQWFRVNLRPVRINVIGSILWLLSQTAPCQRSRRTVLSHNNSASQLLLNALSANRAG